MRYYSKIFYIVLLFSNIISGVESPLYHSIKTSLIKYKLEIYPEQLDYYNGVVKLDLNSRRTNVKSQMLFGFYAVGVALIKTNLNCNIVEVIINYDMKYKNKVYAKSSASQVIDLVKGRINPEQFLNIIK